MVNVAHVLKPRGIHGEVYILFTNPDFTAFSPDSKLNISGKGYEVANFRKYSNKNILSLKSIETRSDAEALRNKDILLEGVEPPPLLENQFYVKDCINCKVEISSGESLGFVVDIERGPAYDFFVVSLNCGGTINIPMVASICKKVSVEEKRLFIDLPDNYISVFSEGIINAG